MNMASFTEELQARIIITILIGEKYATRTTEFEDDNGKVTRVKFVTSIMKMFEIGARRELNPFNILFPELAKCHWMPQDLRYKRNINAFFSELQQIMKERQT
jgi:hypothetical protein